MASLNYRRGAWELRYRPRDRRERSERFPGPPTKRPPEVALDRKAEVERELRRGTFVLREERDITFRVYYERWLGARHVSAAREYTDEGRARLHVLPKWGDRPLSSIRPSDVDDWIIELSRKMGPASVRHCYTVFRGPLRRAIKDGLITNPCIDVPLPKKADLRKTWDDVLTAQEVDQLVAAITDDGPAYAGIKTNHRYRALVFMGAWLGPRWNEAIGIRRCDINPMRKEIAIGRIVVNQNGAKTYLKQFSKTGDFRTIPVPTQVMDVLVAHMEKYCPGNDREEFLFLTRNGTHPLRSNFGRDAIGPALRRTGIDKRVTWLTLRHTAASLMFDAGLSIFEVQQRLGHKSPTMTVEVYTHLMRERFEEGRERMEEYMAKQRKPDEPRSRDSG